MAGYIDLINGIPPILLSQWSITTPLTQTLGDARIMGSNDPQYGAINYIPRLDGTPFAILETTQVKDNDTTESNRIWSTYELQIFLAVEHADTATAYQDFDLICLAWIESLRQTVAANRRLLPLTQTLYPTAGDAQWTMQSGKIIDRRIIFGVPYFGALCATSVRLINAVNYQEG